MFYILCALYFSLSFPNQYKYQFYFLKSDIFFSNMRFFVENVDLYRGIMPMPFYV